MDPLYTIKRLVFVQIFLAALYLFSGCGMQQASKQSFDVTHLLTTFPACFSMQAALHFMGLQHTFHCRVACCVTYDQQIDFIVKGPLGIEVIRGLIDKKGVTVVDRLRRLVYQWDYKRIKQQYHFPCNYLFIQSLLLGRVCSPIEQGVPDALCADLTYTYDDLTRKVSRVQLIDPKQGNGLKFLYQHRMVVDRACLSGIKIHFSLNDKGQFHQGNVTLHKLHFKKLKRPNIKLTIPTYYCK
ncbi:DUF4292 domain-containing protein [Cardinium endosymbiont of Oedothorax gibbosus]|uniref:DUF4292 domain-containing protein n=1 Tax=Cardinium endosymbiont of Oedothorax gibbosus TaxID=931101 RepID=UPI0020253F14|nr:DUF4292 domain-containing protein [Cardinium endosymbiont of Oedothorax gibbosus]CAH2560102.1 Protein of unknown function DUF4292 [Cardinium endosymbiont of Oedothorax gibbosus]